MTADGAGERGQRLHPASLVFRFLTHVRNLLLPGLAVIFVARGGSWELWLMALFVPSAVYEIIVFATLRYRFAERELIIRQGLLFKKERHVPFPRIQNVDLVQGPLHRVVRVAEVRLESASGSEPEAVLKVLSLRAVEEMRERIFAGRRGGAAVAATPDGADGAGTADAAASETDSRVLLRIPVSELVLLGTVSWRGVALIFVLLGVAWELDLFDEWNLWNRAEVTVGVLRGGALGTLWLIALAAVAVSGLMVLSIAWTVLRLFGFTVERRGEDLRISCGLLTRRSATVPRQHIQFVTVSEPALMRAMGRLAVRIETAGGTKDEEGAFSRRWFVPILPRQHLETVLAEVQPGLDFETPAWRPLARKAPIRSARKTLIFWLLTCAVVTSFWRPWGLLVFPVLGLPLAIMNAMEKSRQRWARGDERILYRTGLLSVQRSAAPFRKIQVLQMTESPFDRRYGHALLSVDTAGSGPAGHEIDIPYMDREEARRLIDDLAREAEAAGFSW